MKIKKIKIKFKKINLKINKKFKIKMIINHKKNSKTIIQNNLKFNNKIKIIFLITNMKKKIHLKNLMISLQNIMKKIH